MGRWQKPKPNKADQDRAAGQGFLFEPEAPHLSPWEKDEAVETRRAELVDKKYQSSLTPGEQAELGSLQERFGQHQDKVAPFPEDEIPF